MPKISDEELRRIRNNIPVKNPIEIFLQLPVKEIEGVYQSLCPLCHEFQTSIHPEENAARCFLCQNLNPVDLVMAERALSFLLANKLLPLKLITLNFFSLFTLAA